MLGICFSSLAENTPRTPLQEGEKGVVGSLYGRYQMSDGWFVDGDFQYWMQDNDELGVPLADAGMPVLNLSVGRILQNQRGRISLSVINVLGEDDGLNTLNYFIAPPEERTSVLRANLSF